jgi:hypothetical protein
MFSISRRTKRRRVNNELNLILKNISSTDEDRSNINDSLLQINCSSEEGQNELALDILCCNEKLSGIDNYPIDSTKLHMYRVEGLSSEKACTFNYLFKKCVLMPCNDKEGSFTCIPML